MSVFNVRLVGFVMMISLAVLLPVAMISAAAIEPAREEVTTVVPLSYDLKQETTQPPTEGDTENQPLRCFCNLPECAHTSSVCSTKLGCFKDLRIDLSFAEDAAGKHQADQDGASGCLEMTPIEESCKNMLDSVEHLNTEFPPMQIQSISSNAIYAYHCCQTDMCNDKTKVASTLQAVHEKLVAAYKSSLAVQVKENNATTTNITVEQTAVPDGNTTIDSTNSTIVSSTDSITTTSTDSITTSTDSITTSTDSITTSTDSITTSIDSITTSTDSISTSTDSTTTTSTHLIIINSTAETAESATNYPDEITIVVDSTTKVPEDLDTLKIVISDAQTLKGVNPTDESPKNKPEILNEGDVSQKEEIVVTTTTAIPELPLVSSTEGKKEVM